MREVWLRANRRVFLLGMIPPGLVALLGAGLAFFSWQTSGPWWLTATGTALSLAAICLIAMLAWWMTIPRLAYEDGRLLVFLDRNQPVRVPIDVVECFFLGQGPSQLPPLEGREPETANVIVRLAEAAAEWRHLEVDPKLAQWCEGYITLRGAFCEPIRDEALRRLNHRLAEIHRQRKQSGAAAGASAAAKGAGS